MCVCVCVQRSLSNTEDECTHLKEMNERTQEELQELANKYNGAVNEIKDLTDKIKASVTRPMGKCQWPKSVNWRCIQTPLIVVVALAWSGRQLMQ